MKSKAKKGRAIAKSEMERMMFLNKARDHEKEVHYVALFFLHAAMSGLGKAALDQDDSTFMRNYIMARELSARATAYNEERLEAIKKGKRKQTK